MKHKFLFTFGLIVLGWIVFAAAPVEAVTAAGPYYALPSWDQKLQCDATATCPRFIVLSNWNNEAVLDRETGLVWEQSPSASTFTWSDGQMRCLNLATAGRKGWRLPTFQELMSLVDANAQEFTPHLPSGHPFSNVRWSQNDMYWSATTYDGNSAVAFVTSFYNGLLNGNLKATTPQLTWCVRGGQGVDPQ